jgi:hypothetical protein
MAATKLSGSLIFARFPNWKSQPKNTGLIDSAFPVPDLA